ncbi:hypothetical protein HID58_024015 [Brassica napus]|uniref:DUF1664 domain-containing protein n=2 Tax=Brassica TaxID=3705 RepID=A0ABQ8D3R5_BRANA|nr:hypothetical protein HID58_024015 [Brassica napus]
MAMQSGIGLTRILILAGAGDHSDDDSDDMATQMQRLAMEVRQMSSSRQITVMNGGAQGADFTPFIVPAATLGAIGYGYMWYKGMSFSDIMCVTKRSMEEAVSNLTKHLDTVSEAISNAKKHLTERLKRTDDKMELHKDLLKGVQDNVGLALEDLANIGDDFDSMHSIFGGTGGKLDSIEYKQNIANMGLMYLCDSMGGESHKMPDILMQASILFEDKYMNVHAHSFIFSLMITCHYGIAGEASTLWEVKHMYSHYKRRNFNHRGIV